MFNSALQAIFRPIVAFWRRTSSSSWRRLPRPSDTTTHAAGANADRLLLIGSGIAVGYGVMSHELGLAGHLARRLAESTHRGVFVDIVTSPDLVLAETSQLIAHQQLDRFDAIILAFGGHEAATLQSSAAWRRTLQSVLAEIRQRDGANHVFVVGIPLVDGLPPVYGAIARRRAAHLNTQSALVCAETDDATYVSMSDTLSIEQVRMNRGVYDRWSRVIAPQLACKLDHLAGAPQTAAVRPEIPRQQAVDALNLEDPFLEAELQDILSSARNLFGVDSAAVNIIDGVQQRVHSVVGATGRSLAREDSMCDYTIRGADVMVVEDTLGDTRFSRKYWAKAVPGVRFYAGYPLETPGGERVGALCVFDSSPRTFSVSDGVLLRELALRAQALIRLRH